MDILKMLESTQLCYDIKFGEDDIFDLISNTNLTQYFNYCFGASKLVLIPKNSFINEVYKIPFSGYYNDNGVFCFFSNKNKTFEEGEEWDYCKVEVERYKIAKKYKLNKFFAKTELYGYVNNFYPVYKQKRCIPYNYKSIFSNSRDTKDDPNQFFCSNSEWVLRFYNAYGEKKFKELTDFLDITEWDDDLRNENIGYTYFLHKPILIDYSSFNS